MKRLGGKHAPLAIAGTGLVSAAGKGFDALTHALRRGVDCIRPLAHIPCSDLPVDAGGEIPKDALSTDGAGAGAPRGRAAKSALVAANEAILDANRDALPLDEKRTGLSLGTVFGAIEEWDEGGPGHPIEALARELDEALTLGGPRAIFSMACTSGLCACEQAAADLALGRAEAMVVGAVDTLGRVMQAGFCALGSLEDRPGGTEERGLVLGEAASFVVLEPLERTLARSAEPRALLAAERLFADGRSSSAPDPSGTAMAEAIAATLDDAGLEPARVGAVTLTAARSPAAAAMQRSALRAALGDALDSIPLTSFEPAIGHVLGATSVLVLAHASWLLAETQVFPLLELPSGRVTRESPRPLAYPSVLALSVGLGGHNGVQLVVSTSEARSWR